MRDVTTPQNSPEHYLHTACIQFELTRGDAAPGERTDTPTRLVHYDLVTRRALDAVVVVAYARRPEGLVVWLRSAPRVPLMLRDTGAASHGTLWEVVAGLIDAGETPEAAAARELEEELGVRVATLALEPLGPSVFPAPGIIAEQQHFFAIALDAPPAEPEGDGSALEAASEIVCVTLDAALAAARGGALQDSKTELALRRLRERLVP
jgi:ADP-ribose pyrophosphatase